ncbi:uncharacterized protein LOC144660122 isoform X2 [Oculina patagonica]
MGIAWSSYKEKRKEKKELKRKQRLRSSFLNSEREKLLKLKAQMEQQIQALEEQIILEKLALIDRSNRLQQLVESFSSPEINKLAEQKAISFPGNESEQMNETDSFLAPVALKIYTRPRRMLWSFKPFSKLGTAHIFSR